MVLIMLTGNYNFFNFIYIALCLSLADDTWLLGELLLVGLLFWNI